MHLETGSSPRWLGAAALLYALYIGLSVSMTIHWFADFASGIIFGIIVGTTVGRSFAAMNFPSMITKLQPKTVLESTK